MNWVLLHTTSDNSEALVLQSVLESADIKYKIAKESLGKLYGLSMNGLGEVKIYVPEEKLEEAKELLNSKSKI